MCAQIVIMSSTPNYSCYQRPSQNPTASKTKGFAWLAKQGGVVSAVAIYTWPLVPVRFILAHSKCEISSTLWLPQPSDSHCWTLITSQCVWGKRCFPTWKNTFFRKGFFWEGLLVPTLAFSPTEQGIHWWFTQKTPCWTSLLGPYSWDSDMWVKFSCMLHSASVMVQSAALHFRVSKWSVSDAYALCWFSDSE